MKQIYLLFLLFISSVGFSQEECRVSFITSSDPIPIEPFQPVLFGQGFEAECTGLLEYVEFIGGRSGFVAPGTLNIYEGNTVVGEPVYSQPHPEILVTGNGSGVRVTLDDVFNVVEGEQYAFEFLIYEMSIIASFPNSYAGGSAWQNSIEQFPDVDFFFNVSIMDDPLSTEDVFFQNELKVFPNPSTDFIQVSGLTSSVDYKIYNVLGAEVKRGAISNQELIDVNDFSNGLYVLQLNDQRGFKFIKE